MMKMMKFRTVLRTVATLVAIVGVSGCVREPMEEKQWIIGVAELPEYPPLERYNLEIQLQGRREIYTGTDGMLPFSLVNRDAMTVNIPEWHAHDAKNLRVYIQPWIKGENNDEPFEDEWLLLPLVDREIVVSEAKVGRYPLELKPDNSILIPRYLGFTETLELPPTGELRYFVKAELNLTSVKVESPLFAVAVLSPLAPGNRVIVEEDDETPAAAWPTPGGR